MSGTSSEDRTGEPAPRAPRGHRSRTAPEAPVPPASRPAPGAVSVGPRPSERFVTAVEAAGAEVVPVGPDTRGLVWLSYRSTQELSDVLDAHPGIEWVQLPWAGVDAFADVLRRHAGRDRLLWTSAKGAYSEPVAEHALVLTLALLRLVRKRVEARTWATLQEGRSLYGRRVVVVGAGGIAREYLRLLEPFDCETVVVRRSPEAVPGAVRTVATSALHDELREADVVLLAAASTDETRRLVGERELALLPDTAVLVNVARGPLVDTDALVAALREERLWGAALDVTDPEPLPDGHPLWTEPRAIVTPHQADTPEMTAPLLAERITTNVRALLGDGEFVGVVDPVAGY